MYAGIDYSLTCPAITIGGLDEDFTKCQVHYYTKDKKFCRDFMTNIHGHVYLPYSSQMERIENLSSWAMNILTTNGVTKAVIEGYALGAKGRVFDLAENGGLLKWKMWTAKIDFSDPSPMTLKKFFTGKGNSNKVAMHDAFVKKTGISIAKELGRKEDSNPVSDIVDSYSAFCYNFI